MKFWSRGAEAAPPVAEAPDDPSRWIGFIDRIDRNVIQGWCFDRRNPEKSLVVEAQGSLGSRNVMIACLFRQDVKDGGFGSGHLGFELDLSDFDDAESVTIRLTDCQVPLTTTPIALDPISAVCTHALPERFVKAARQLATEVGMRHGEWKRQDPLTLDDEAPYDRRLLHTFDPDTDPEGLITRFVAQENVRIARDAHKLDRLGSFQERLGVLFWYIDDYAATRPALSQVPLTQNQIDVLNAPAAIVGNAEVVTVALQNFVLRYLPSHANFRDKTCLLEAVYWWCVERAPRTKLADRLVTDRQIAFLKAPSDGAGTLFPCNVFMTMYAQKHPQLCDLDLKVPRDRLALLCYLVIASFLEPSLLRLLPHDMLRRLLRADSEGHTSLDTMLGRFAASQEQQLALSIVGAELRRKGDDLLSAAGVALSISAARRPSLENLEAVSHETGLRPGLGVIGPYSKSSGLGRAMRLSLEAAEAVEAIAPAFLDFALENVGPAGGGTPARHPALDTPREITLLHQNMEVLPLAFVNAPRRLLSGSYCIAFPFWELNELAECQRLALDLVDEIWVASEYNRELFARYTSKPVIRVGMAAPALPLIEPVPRTTFGLKPDHFTFIATFDSFSFIARKNPEAVIEAFRRAFPRGSEPAQLVIKTQNRGRVTDGAQLRVWQQIDRIMAKDPRMILVDETLSFTELLGLMRSCDAYVSLHRSEGWGFGLVEAMQLGLPVICTGYSGNVDFCMPQTAFMVDYDLILVGSDEYIFVPKGSVWADPSVASAAAQMRHVMNDRADAARKADAARDFVHTHLGLDTTARRYAERLASIRTNGRPKFD